MKYPKEYLDEIKTRLKVSTVVSKSVALKKRGKEYVGLSPFKTEKTPSFTVNDEKEFYHCFATSEHGNIFDFVMKTQNFKFGEAVKHLAQLAGMQPYMFSKQDEEREKKWKEYLSIYSQYVDFYHSELLKNEKYSKDNRKYGVSLYCQKNIGCFWIFGKSVFHSISVHLNLGTRKYFSKYLPFCRLHPGRTLSLPCFSSAC